MNAIKSIYIPHVEKHFNAEYIANVFNDNGIAQVSRIYIEPYKSINKNRLNVFNRAFVEIKKWHETEAAYSFIKRLRNPNTEARIIHSGDNWWAVEINRNPSKFNSIIRVMTLFNEQNEIDDEISTIAVGSIDNDELDVFVKIDAEKTQLLRRIVAKLTEQAVKPQALCESKPNNSDYDAYLREIGRMRWENIYTELCN